MTESKSVAVHFEPFPASELAWRAPLSQGQQAIYRAIALHGDEANCAHLDGFELQLRGKLDEAALVRALVGLAERHDALRATLTHDGSALSFAATSNLEPERVDLSVSSERESALSALRAALVSTPLDLVTGPLLRAVLVRMRSDDHRLLVVTHQIVCDRSSYGILLRELGALYGAEKRGGSADLDVAESYAEYAEERARREQTLEGMRATSAHERVLYELPLERARGRAHGYRTERAERELDAELVSALQALAQAHGASVAELLLIALGPLLARLERPLQLVIDLFGGETQARRRRLVGHALGYVALSAEGLGSALGAERPSAAAALKSTRAALEVALSGDDYDPAGVREPLPLRTGREPVAAVSVHGEPALRSCFSGLTVSLALLPRAYGAFELSVQLIERAGSVTIEVQSRRELLDGAALGTWLASYEALLGALLQSPEQALSALAQRALNEGALAEAD